MGKGRLHPDRGVWRLDHTPPPLVLLNRTSPFPASSMATLREAPSSSMGDHRRSRALHRNVGSRLATWIPAPSVGTQAATARPDALRAASNPPMGPAAVRRSISSQPVPAAYRAT